MAGVITAAALNGRSAKHAEPIKVAAAPAPAPSGSDDVLAQKYLEVAGTLRKQKRFDLAQEVLKESSQLQIKSPELNIQIAKMADAIIVGGSLKKAESLVKAGDWRGAMEASKVALDRDADNAEAIKILAVARTGFQTAGVEQGAKPKDHSLMGTLSVETTPPATVYVDDELIGRSPIRRRSIRAGDHMVQVRAQGYQPATSTINVVTGRNLALVVPLAGTPEPQPPAPEAAAIPSATVAPTPAAKIGPPPVAAPAQVRSPGPIVSVRPRSPVPKPTLPREHVAQNADEVSRICQLVESAAVSLGGVSPEFARGITGPFRRSVASGGPMYGIAMYYFIIREASLQHDSKTAAENLAAAQSKGLLLHLKDLPGNDRDI
jgi:hypothetical protein